MMNTMTPAETLLAYSEWLDSEKLMGAVAADDQRTHQNLITSFINYWEENPNRALLAGSTNYDDDPDLPYENDNKYNDKADIAPSTKEAVKVLTKLAKSSKKESIRLQAAQTLLSYNHVVGF